MTQSIVQVIFPVILLTSFLALVGCNGDDSSTRKAQSYVKGDVELRVVPIEGNVHAGEVIPLKIEVINSSDHDIVIDRTFAFGWNVHVTAVDARGESYSSDDWKIRVRSAPASDRLDFAKLSPGEYFGSVDGVGSLFHIDTPGIYDITFTLSPAREEGNLDDLGIDNYIEESLVSAPFRITVS